MAMAIRYVSTDAAGSFMLDQLEYETYNVFVEKEADDYAPSQFSLYSDRPSGTVTLCSQYPTRNSLIARMPISFDEKLQHGKVSQLCASNRESIRHLLLIVT
jgi:hypothetical protein